MTQTITINELYRECAKMIRNGHGKKSIIIPTDDEGNNYRNLYYLFVEEKKEIETLLKCSCFCGEVDLDNVIILG